MGISALHGGQYVAQKLITSGLPASEPRLTRVLLVPVSEKAGARPPVCVAGSIGPVIVSSALSTSADPHPSPPDASSWRPSAPRLVTSCGGRSWPTAGTPR